MPASHPSQYNFDKVFRFINLSTTGQIPAVNDGCYVTGMVLSNAHNGVRYFKIYNKATAATEADTPVMTILLPHAGSMTITGLSIPFPLGISVRACQNLADNDTTAPGSNEVTVNIFYRD